MALIDDLAAALIARGTDPSTFDPDALVAELDPETVEAILRPILEEEEYARFNRFKLLFPDEGPLRRELYPKHMEFFAASKTHREICFLAGNRCGKTIAGAFAMTAHLTGEYPHWWPGRVFRRPIRAWAAGDTNETTRDIIQLELLGNVVAGSDGRKGFDGSGMIPRECIGQPRWKQGVQDLVDTIPILHKTGGWSHLGFKSFDQGRRAFQGTQREVVWLDEECAEEVYNECCVRTMTTRGIVLTTFTPLEGLSKQVLQFVDPEMRAGGK